MAASNFSLGLNILVYEVGFLMGSASVGIVSMLSVFLNTVVSYYYCPGDISAPLWQKFGISIQSTGAQFLCNASIIVKGLGQAWALQHQIQTLGKEPP